MTCVHSKDLRIAVPEGPDTCGSGISLGETLLIALLDRDWEERSWKWTSFLPLGTVPFLGTYSTKSGEGHGFFVLFCFLLMAKVVRIHCRKLGKRRNRKQPTTQRLKLLTYEHIFFQIFFYAHVHFPQKLKACYIYSSKSYFHSTVYHRHLPIFKTFLKIILITMIVHHLNVTII